MKLVTASQSRALDQAAFERVPSLDLMEAAGKSVAEVVKKYHKKGLVAVVVGKGNNGGDGLVAARYLKKAGFDIVLCLLSPWTEFSNDARVNWDRLADLNIRVVEDAAKFSEDFEKATCVIDAIFGTGLAQEVKGKYKAVIELINSLVKSVVAIDIPSGLSADTGEPLGVAIRARHTVTFGMMKVGLATTTGHEYAHDVSVVDIGIPKDLTDKLETGYYLTTPDMFAEFFGPRPKNSHKGDFGHVLVVGGSSGKIGAGLLASRAALRSGAGLVTYALPQAAYAKFDAKSPEIMYEGLADRGSGRLTKDSIVALKSLLHNKNAVAIGPGIGTEEDTKKVVAELLGGGHVPVVIDADGLNCLEGKLDSFSGKKNPIVFTPHPGEMSRLIGKSVKEIQTNRIAIAKGFAKTHHLYLVLKGNRTVVATPGGDIFINTTGNPAMASAGMGDVLTGVIASFIAQKLPVQKAVIAGVYLHGLAGDIAMKEVGERGLIASDVINCLPKAIRSSWE